MGNRRFVLQDAGACVTARAVDAGACVVDGGRAGAFRSLVSSLVGGGGEKSLRCLPSFLIVGAQKAATGSLSDWLSRHPMLRRGSGPKAHAREVHYFDRLRGNATASVDGTWRDYLGAFPRPSTGQDKGATLANFKALLSRSFSTGCSTSDHLSERSRSVDLFLWKARARAEHPRRSDIESPSCRPGSRAPRRPRASRRSRSRRATPASRRPWSSRATSCPASTSSSS